MQQLTRDELIELVTKLCNGDVKTEAEADQILDTIEASVTHPAVSDLIFWSDELTPEQIVEQALAHQPTPLPERW